MSTNVISLDSKRRSRPAGRASTYGGAKPGRRASDLWRNPIDLDPDLTAKLLRGLAESHRLRLEVFAREGERVSMHQLLVATGDTDLRVLSHFQGALCRRLQRLLDNRDKRIHLIGWDYATTRWDDDHTNIVDGICYVTKKSQKSLMQCLVEAKAEGL